MHIYRLRLEDLDEKTLQRLRHEHANALIELRVVDDRPPEPMPEGLFWAVIDRLDGDADTAAGQLAPAVAFLAEQPVDIIYRFDDTLARKLYQLDTQAHAQNLTEPNGYLSVDDFLYARCAVVALGREFYQDVLDHPERMPEDVTFEPLLRLVGEAYQQKTGAEYFFYPSLSYEIYSNAAGW